MFCNFEKSWYEMWSGCGWWGVIKWKLEINTFKRRVSQFREDTVWDVIRVWRVGCNQVKTAPSLEDNRCQIEDKQSADHWNSNMVIQTIVFLRKKLRQAVNVVKLWPASHSLTFLIFFIKAVNYKRSIGDNWSFFVIKSWIRGEILPKHAITMLTNSDPTFCPDLLPIPLRVYFPKQLNRPLHYRPPRVSLNIQYRRSDNLSKQRFHEVHLEFRISFTKMQLNSRITII